MEQGSRPISQEPIHTLTEERLRAKLSAELTQRGEWHGDSLPHDAFSRWVNASSLNDWESHADNHSQETVVADFMGYWQDWDTGLREYVIHGQRGPLWMDRLPAWWPVYEQWAAEQVEPHVTSGREALARLDSESLADVISAEGQVAEAVQQIATITGAHPHNVRMFLEGRAPLKIVPLQSITGGIMPSVTLEIASPWIDSRAVVALYEQAVADLRREQARPPEIEPESVAFFLAYDDLVQRGIRGKAERLEALPPELRGTRNANSAAAYYGKLKKTLRAAFPTQERSRDDNA